MGPSRAWACPEHRDQAIGGSGTGPRTFTVTFNGGSVAATDVNPTMTGSHMGITCGTNCGSPSVVETTKGGAGDAATPNCDGSAVNNYCNLKVPGSGTTPLLFASSNVTSTLATTAFRGPSISAALLTVAHSFGVQNYRYGPAFSTYSAPASLLTVTGAIAQKYRGTVGVISGGTITAGYAKNYGYDQRLKYDSPPHFLDPVASAWQVVTWAEQKPAFPASAP